MRPVEQAQVQHILISRVDAIGDVVLTLPMAAYLKALYPQAVVSFLGRTYTKPVILSCTSVDIFINYDELLALPQAEQVKYLQNKKIDIIIHVFPNKHIADVARRAGIPVRIGTTNRLFHWFNCNRLVKLSRKKSVLHEAQLNLILLKPLGLANVQSIPDVVNHYNFECKILLPRVFEKNLLKDKFNLIIHPKSHGSGMEWGLDNYARLINTLPANNYNIIITGSDKEKLILDSWIKTLSLRVTNLSGKMTLDELIAFIFTADGLLASGTGPLHIAAASGINTLGLFPSLRPIHPGRWAPIGLKAGFIESPTHNLDGITTNMVLEKINEWHNNKLNS